MKMKRMILVLPLLLLLGACSKFEGMFSEDTLPPLTGERISILQMQRALAPDPMLASSPVTLPEAWVNKFWPQAGGYPNHAMGQLALGAELQKAWSSSIGRGGDRREPLIVQPVVAEGLVFTLDTEGRVAAFDLVEGDEKWSVSSVMNGEEDTGAIGGGLAYAGGRLYVTNGYKQLLCLDAQTGKPVWRTATPSPARSAPTVADDKIYLVTMSNQLMVFSTVDGTPVWNYVGITETTNLLGSVSPAVDQSMAVLPLSSGEIYGLRVENGQPVWEDNLSAIQRVGTLSAIADIRGQPVIDRGVVYAASYSGRMVALDGVSGQRLWQREVGSAEMPWAADDTVFIISADQQLMALTRSNGDIRWITSLTRYEGDNKEKPIVWTGPVLAGGRLIAASSNGEMVEADPQTGQILKTSEVPGSVTIAPLVADNTLLLLTQGGELVAYR